MAIKEYVKSQQPGSASFLIDGGKAILTYDVPTAELDDAITEILGSCSARGDGSLSRTLPLAHPRFPWLFAEKILNIQGIGSPTKTAAETELEAPTFTHYADYPYYRFQVEFAPRPYAVLDDLSIGLVTSSYYDNDGNSVAYDYATEWDRFLDIDPQPSLQLITADFGQMKLTTGATSGDQKPYPAKVSVRMPGAAIRLIWHQVPQSYMLSANSYLVNYQGYVNQTEFLGKPAGTLLLDKVTSKRYTPPVPDVIPGSIGLSYSTEKLCDIEIILQYANREAEYDPSLSGSNGNFIAAGHNVLPHFLDRKFYYARAVGASPDTDKTKWYPLHFSIPFQLLFTDPDT